MTHLTSVKDRACKTEFYGLNLEITVLQVELVAAQYEQLSFGKAIDAIQKVSARGNLFLQEREPWAAFKKVHTCTHAPGEITRLELPVVVYDTWTCHGWLLFCLQYLGNIRHDYGAFEHAVQRYACAVGLVQLVHIP